MHTWWTSVGIPGMTPSRLVSLQVAGMKLAEEAPVPKPQRHSAPTHVKQSGPAVSHAAAPLRQSAPPVQVSALHSTTACCVTIVTTVELEVC